MCKKRQRYVYGIVSHISSVCDGPCLVKVPVIDGELDKVHTTFIARSATSTLCMDKSEAGLHVGTWSCLSPTMTVYKTKAAAWMAFIAYVL